MKNLKRALSLVLSTAMLVGMMVVGTGAAELKDIKGHDNQEAAELMAMIGVMEGDGEKFNPDNIVTRNEMAVVMCNLLDLKLNGDHPFTDVATWADDYVAALYTNGYTAGKSATTFGGNDKITTAEAALMIMKTLGYFEFQGEFGDDWKLATVKRATELKLFDDVNAGINEKLTRGEVAQMVMNALDENVVIANEKGGMSVEGNGITVTEKPEYTHAVIGDNNQGGTAYVTLMDKLYDYTLRTNRGNDAFGRPATVWTYTGGEKATDSITVADKADIIFTTKQDDNDVAKALKDYTYAATERVVVDGAKTNGAFSYSNVAKADLDDQTGNGARVEIFADNQSQITDIVIINEYVGKILLVTDAKEDKGIKRSVTISGYPAFETEDFAKKDWVKFTQADGVIKSMVPAETVEGKVTAEATGFIKIDGVTYKPTKLYGNTNLANEIDLSDDVIVFVDSYGFIIDLKEKVAAIADVEDYVVVTGGITDDWGTELVKVVYSDGTKATVELDNTGVDFFPQNATTFADNMAGLYTYEKTDDGVKFTAYDNSQDNNGKYAGYDAILESSNSYDKDTSTLGTGLNSLRIADDAVVFVKYEGSKYKVITGAELKKIDENNFTSTTVAYANKNTSGYKYVELAYVTVSTISGTDDVAYGYVVADVEEVKNADDITVDSITFWNGTENVTLLAANNTAPVAKGDFFSYKLNADGEMTNFNVIPVNGNNHAAYAVSAFDGKKIELSNTNASWGTSVDVDEDSVIIYVNVEDESGVAAGEIEIADKDSSENYIYNVVATMSDGDIDVLFVDVKNDIRNVNQ